MKKLLLCVATFALALASAAPNVFRLTIEEPTWIAGNELKPGEYKVEIQDGKAIFKSGKKSVEVNAKMENIDKKYQSTAIVVHGLDKKSGVEEIHFGGTTTKLVFAN